MIIINETPVAKETYRNAILLRELLGDGDVLSLKYAPCRYFSVR
jgi:hypothetical protein